MLTWYLWGEWLRWVLQWGDCSQSSRRVYFLSVQSSDASRCAWKEKCDLTLHASYSWSHTHMHTYTLTHAVPPTSHTHMYTNLTHTHMYMCTCMHTTHTCWVFCGHYSSLAAILAWWHPVSSQTASKHHCGGLPNDVSSPDACCPGKGGEKILTNLVSISGESLMKNEGLR